MQKSEKIVEDYQLEETIQIMASGIYVLKAKHVKTNQYFTIKKVSIPSEKGNENQISGEKILMRQVESLKNINVKGFIKCLKLIRTKRNIYCVFQEYPPYQLAEYLTLFQPPLSQRIKYAQLICQTLSKIHEKGYIYGNLNPGCILVDKAKNALKFIGLQYLSENQKNQPIRFDSLNEYMSPQVKRKGKISFSSDAFSLGKILALLGLTNSRQQEKFTTPIQGIIKNLLSNSPSVRPTLKTVSLCLQIKGNQNSTSESNDLSFSIEKSKKYNSVRITKSDNKNKKHRSINTKPIIKLEKVNADEKKTRKIMKIRNLSIYILDLGKFCLKHRRFRLSYLLIKKATILTGNLIQELKKDPLTTKQNYEELVKVLKYEYNEQSTFLEQVKQVLGIKQDGNKIQEAELENEIMEFINEKRKSVKEIKTNFNSEERVVLVRLYQLSQKITYGCFQKFFNEAFSEQYIKLQDQRYIQYLNMLPTKELLQKIDNAIKSS